jgi:GNAT superfamily N-acetyltransferase
MSYPTGNVPEMVEIRAVDAGSRDALAELFTANGTVAGCGCMYFVVDPQEFKAGWHSGANRARLLDDAAHAAPIGLLAYSGGRAVGWCAAGPRSRYARAMRSPLVKERDPAADDSVWFLPCLFVRAGERRKGVAVRLLTAAVELARNHGAPAVEGFPLTGGAKRASGDAYLGTEAMFAAAGFSVVRRPTGNRTIMRVDLG